MRRPTLDSFLHLWRTQITTREFSRSFAPIIASTIFLSALVSTKPVFGQSASTEIHSVADYKSRNFLMHTDLSPEKADLLLTRLEFVLRTISRYWGRPLQERIECYIVDDLSNWHQSELPHRNAHILLQRIGGGVDFHSAPANRRSQYKVHIYATSQPGIAEHEVVHAYCAQAFGAMGPDWYKEGMAEMVSRQRGKPRGLNCSAQILSVLRAGAPRTVDEIVDSGEFTGPLSAVFAALPDSRSKETGRPLAKSRHSWGADDDKILRKAKATYYWSWTLCHFLSNHPKYRDRFRALGRGYLHQQDVSFRQVFGPVSDRLAFEYELFLRNLDNGYRVDLCRWDWGRNFTRIRSGDSKRAQVFSARGYQASGVLVTAGEHYQFHATGTWTTEKGGSESTADGNHGRSGRLMGVVFRDYTLSRPFRLGSSGSFGAPRSGQLYLRCDDKWNELADNSGVVHVRLQRKDTAHSPKAKSVIVDGSGTGT